MTIKSQYSAVDSYTTKDGSMIRELMHPQVQGNRNQSLAEARVAVGACTQLHVHKLSEEIYHVTAGQGLLTLGGEEIPLQPGDSVCIPPGTPHKVRNTGHDTLTILCCCAPPYSHQDTQLLD